MKKFVTKTKKEEEINARKWYNGTWFPFQCQSSVAGGFYSSWNFSIFCAQAKSSERGLAPEYRSMIASKRDQNWIFSKGQLSQPVVTKTSKTIRIFIFQQDTHYKNKYHEERLESKKKWFSVLGFQWNLPWWMRWCFRGKMIW